MPRQTDAERREDPRPPLMEPPGHEPIEPARTTGSQIETERPPHDERGPSPVFDPTGQDARVPPRPARSTGWQRPTTIAIVVVAVLLLLFVLF
jgi:hypothetical protein